MASIRFSAPASYEEQVGNGMTEKRTSVDVYLSDNYIGSLALANREDYSAWFTPAPIAGVTIPEDDKCKLHEAKLRLVRGMVEDMFNRGYR